MSSWADDVGQDHSDHERRPQTEQAEQRWAIALAVIVAAVLQAERCQRDCASAFRAMGACRDCSVGLLLLLLVIAETRSD